MENEEEYYENPAKQKRRKRREGNRKHKKHLKRLSEFCDNLFAPSYFVMCYRGKDGEVKKSYYKRLYRNHWSSYYKRQSNVQVRRHNKDALRGGEYKKCDDFWWSLN